MKIYMDINFSIELVFDSSTWPKKPRKWKDLFLLLNSLLLSRKSLLLLNYSQRQFQWVRFFKIFLFNISHKFDRLFGREVDQISCGPASFGNSKIVKYFNRKNKSFPLYFKILMELLASLLQILWILELSESTAFLRSGDFLSSISGWSWATYIEVISRFHGYWQS